MGDKPIGENELFIRRRYGVGDDITISGKITQIYNEQFIIIQGQSGEEYCINIEDIKTHRPIWREGE